MNLGMSPVSTPDLSVDERGGARHALGPPLSSFVGGALFAVGLAVSGMTKPAKIVGFLDVFGAWDASLAFVMAGALLVHVITYRLITKRASPLFEGRFHIPTRRDVDLRLVVGSALFGVGWGLGGYCPGPGLVSAASGALSGTLFVIGMTAGMKFEHWASRLIARRE